jgi:hypothetical protein
MNAAEVEPGWYRWTIADAQQILMNKSTGLDFMDYLAGGIRDECYTDEVHTQLVAHLTDWGLI